MRELAEKDAADSMESENDSICRRKEASAHNGAVFESALLHGESGCRKEFTRAKEMRSLTNAKGARHQYSDGESSVVRRYVGCGYGDTARWETLLEARHES